MLTEEDFKVPLEKQLKMRLLCDEVDNCKDVKQLQENLKACAESLMHHQHLLSILCRQQLMQELEKWDTEASKIIKEALLKEKDGSERTGES
jgi:hypothetical protein